MKDIEELRAELLGWRCLLDVAVGVLAESDDTELRADAQQAEADATVRIAALNAEIATREERGKTCQ